MILFAPATGLIVAIVVYAAFKLGEIAYYADGPAAGGAVVAGVIVSGFIGFILTMIKIIDSDDRRRRKG